MNDSRKYPCSYEVGGLNEKQKYWLPILFPQYGAKCVLDSNLLAIDVNHPEYIKDFDERVEKHKNNPDIVKKMFDLVLWPHSFEDKLHYMTLDGPRCAPNNIWPHHAEARAMWTDKLNKWKKDIGYSAYIEVYGDEPIKKKKDAKDECYIHIFD